MHAPNPMAKHVAMNIAKSFARARPPKGLPEFKLSNSDVWSL